MSAYARSSSRVVSRLAAHAIETVEAPAALETTLEELKRLGPYFGSEVGMDQLLEGHIQVYSTVDHRIQHIAKVALENGLKLYEKRHSQSMGLIQGSVVVLRNSDSAILAETGGRDVYKGRTNTYSDYNRATQSKRQPGSTMKPLVYLAAFRQGVLDLDTLVPDEPNFHSNLCGCVFSLPHLIPVTLFSAKFPLRRCIFIETVKLCAPKSPPLSDDFAPNFATF